MIKVKVTKNGTLTHGGQFESLELAQSWINEQEQKKSWGIPAHTEQVLVSPESTELQELFDENGNPFDPALFEEVVVPAVYETIHVPAEYSVEIEDISAQVEAEAAKVSKILAGQKAREACQKVLDYVAGENLDKELTIQQISELQATFSQAEAALRAGRPTFAKMFISAIEADGVLVSEEMKSTCLELLADF